LASQSENRKLHKYSAAEKARERERERERNFGKWIFVLLKNHLRLLEYSAEIDFLDIRFELWKSSSGVFVTTVHSSDSGKDMV
jgi:hypothetical protein